MPDFTKIKWQPGYWVDWDGTRQGLVIRDAIGQVVFTDIHVNPADVERINPKLAAFLKQKLGMPPQGTH